MFPGKPNALPYSPITASFHSLDGRYYSYIWNNVDPLRFFLGHILVIEMFLKNDKQLPNPDYSPIIE